jgi:hypothetical protein
MRWAGPAILSSQSEGHLAKAEATEVGSLDAKGEEDEVLISEEARNQPALDRGRFQPRARGWQGRQSSRP